MVFVFNGIVSLRTYASLGTSVALGIDPDVLGNDDSPLVEIGVLVDDLGPRNG